MTTTRSNGLPITEVSVTCLTVPTQTPDESDGTHVWSSTTMVLVELRTGDVHGLGYTYGHPAVATIVEHTFTDLLVGRDALATRQRYDDLRDALRNAGRPGMGAHAISAVDTALWDLKARAFDVALIDLLGAARPSVPVYGSGGFCNYTEAELSTQLSGWVEQGITSVKMKVGRDPDRDPARVASARAAIGDDAELMVDANGAYDVQLALACSERFAEHGVSWHEEPVSSENPRGLANVRAGIPAGMSVAAGEYAYGAFDVRDLIHADAVDCAQADVTRCGGITGFLDVAALCDAEQVELSAHTAPAISLAACAAAPNLRHLEYFHDHVRIERELFDGFPEPVDGQMAPDRSRPGHGLELRRGEVEQYRD